MRVPVFIAVIAAVLMISPEVLSQTTSPSPSPSPIIYRAMIEGVITYRMDAGAYVNNTAGRQRQYNSSIKADIFDNTLQTGVQLMSLVDNKEDGGRSLIVDFMWQFESITVAEKTLNDFESALAAGWKNTNLLPTYRAETAFKGLDKDGKPFKDAIITVDGSNTKAKITELDVSSAQRTVAALSALFAALAIALAF